MLKKSWRSLVAPHVSLPYKKYHFMEVPISRNLATSWKSAFLIGAHIPISKWELNMVRISLHPSLFLIFTLNFLSY